MGIDTWSLIASITSAILAIVAILLSLAFYALSIKQAQLSQRSSDISTAEVRSIISSLNSQFEQLRTETFDLLRIIVVKQASTTNAPQPHTPRSENPPGTHAGKATGATDKELVKSIEETSEFINELASAYNPAGLVDSHGLVYDVINKLGGKAKFSQIYARVFPTYESAELRAALYDLREQGLITWQGNMRAAEYEIQKNT
jgi:hypothetical protein